VHNRREFLKLLGLAVGASLSGCGGSSDSDLQLTPGGALPNGYQFVPLIGSGDNLPNLQSIRAQSDPEGPPFVGAVMVNDKRHVCFHANDQGGAGGAYRLDYSSDGQKTPPKKLIREGDTLPDGSIVEDLYPGDINNLDEFVFVVESTERVRTVQYSRDDSPFERLCTSYTKLSDEANLYGALHTDITLANNSSKLVFSCNHRTDEVNSNEGPGLFYAPIDNLSGSRKLLSSAQLLPGTTATLDSFGLFDFDDQDNYVVLGSAHPVGTLNESYQTCLVRGRLGEEPETLVASPELGISGAIQGASFSGPRLNGSDLGFIVQKDDSKTEFWLNDRKLLNADFEQGADLSPRGARIISMFPPVFGPNGLLYIQLFTNRGIELAVYDGGRFSTILATGDLISGKTVADILFGALPHCVNTHGDLVCVAEFTDGQSAILLGTPI
jgi:hypothetical protein